MLWGKLRPFSIGELWTLEDPTLVVALSGEFLQIFSVFP